MRFLMTTVTWADPIKMHPKLIDELMAIHGDWLRVNPHVWFTYTSSSRSEVIGSVGKNLSNNDIVLCTEVKPAEIEGLAQDWVWKWFGARMHQIGQE